MGAEAALSTNVLHDFPSDGESVKWPVSMVILRRLFLMGHFHSRDCQCSQVSECTSHGARPLKIERTINAKHRRTQGAKLLPRLLDSRFTEKFLFPRSDVPSCTPALQLSTSRHFYRPAQVRILLPAVKCHESCGISIIGCFNVCKPRSITSVFHFEFEH